MHLNPLKLAGQIRRALARKEEYERVAEQVLTGRDPEGTVEVDLPAGAYRFRVFRVLDPGLSAEEAAGRLLLAANQALDQADGVWTRADEELGS